MVYKYAQKGSNSNPAIVSAKIVIFLEIFVF